FQPHYNLDQLWSNQLKPHLYFCRLCKFHRSMSTSSEGSNHNFYTYTSPDEIPTFYGKLDENPNTFLSSWFRVALIHNWSNRNICLRFPNSLKGQAGQWFAETFPLEQIPTEETALECWRKYISAFTKKYKDPYRINMARQQVWDRKQFRGESTSNYLKAIQKIGANIGSSDEMFFAAMRGMNPEAARLM